MASISDSTVAPCDIRSVELEITGTCQLRCTHCCTGSSPQVPVGSMKVSDWRRVMTEIAEIGVPMVQLIGGEPTLNPDLPQLVDVALALGLGVEVYSNLVHVRPALWEIFSRDGVRLATSYYSDDAAQHEKITQGRGSHARTLANIGVALRRGIPLRVGIVEVLDGQRVRQAEAELRALGVEQIQIDRTRRVGRAAGSPGVPPSVDELCGRCFRQRVAISPDGEVYGCILSRFLPAGNVKDQGLSAILRSSTWAEIVERIPMAQDPCTPQDSSDCDPANTPACLPKFPE
ncbi:radical SAM protein [Streptomyces telluris]|uniref:Radical SAM protein n=1 Tax=Streptomyces telluris TaxID=2720021 RepID=A0A9X2LPX6_9ACTN|nr:radical SAM protein [Streptomyces telluris]MCQ8774836.1 radical SAM protein [Streptomyces telluris]NJP76695.1 radical SAM protein [Streptomyces telluris]